MADSRSKEVAWEALQTAREEVLRTNPDENVQRLLTPELLQQVFGEAWRLQFEDDGAVSQAALRQIVVDAFDAAELGEATR